jgi:hypothetical protein
LDVGLWSNVYPYRVHHEHVTRYVACTLLRNLGLLICVRCSLLVPATLISSCALPLSLLTMPSTAMSLIVVVCLICAFKSAIAGERGSVSAVGLLWTCAACPVGISAFGPHVNRLLAISSTVAGTETQMLSLRPQDACTYQHILPAVAACKFPALGTCCKSLDAVFGRQGPSAG